MAKLEPRRVLVAQLTGIAEQYGYLHRMTRDKALGKIAEQLHAAGIQPGSPEAVDALTDVASAYSTEDPPFERWWHTDAFALLVAAGADVDRARQPRTEGPNPGAPGPQQLRHPAREAGR